jgi:chromosome segregation ATPase
LIKGPLAAQPVDSLMDDVQVKRSRLQARIEILNNARQYFTAKDAELAVQQGALLRIGQENLKGQVAGTADDVKNIAHDIKDLTQQLQNVHAMIQQQEQDRVKIREDTLRKEICNRWMALLDDSHVKRSKLREPD